MDAVIRKVRDLEERDRHVLERVLGRTLHENQQIVVQIVTLGGNKAQSPTASNQPGSDELPDWCNVYEGLTAEQVADLESVILERADLTRPS
jgi:hypothetical protein